MKNQRLEACGPVRLGRSSPRKLGRRVYGAAGALTCVCAAFAGGAQEQSGIEIGAPAPALSCAAPDDKIPNLRAFLGRPVILLFGEPYHERSLAAASELANIAALPEFARAQPKVYMISARRPVDRIADTTVNPPPPSIECCLDALRKTYSDYGVRVLPTTVVLDDAGDVLCFLAGKPLNYSDRVTDACRVAAGLLSREAFKASSSAHAPSSAEVASHQADTLAQMALRLRRLGKFGLAEDKYKEALILSPTSVSARGGLGHCYLEQSKLAEAEVEFRQVLAIEPDDVPANLGLAGIALVRGGEEVVRAGASLAGLLARRSHDAELNFMMGRLEQSQDHNKEALGYYKRAAELLLEQRDDGRSGRD